jgi:hypothetical protein
MIVAAKVTARNVQTGLARSVLSSAQGGLEVASAHSEVNVTGQTVMVDTNQTISDTVQSRDAADLPLNGRDLILQSAPPRLLQLALKVVF